MLFKDIIDLTTDVVTWVINTPDFLYIFPLLGMIMAVITFHFYNEITVRLIFVLFASFSSLHAFFTIITQFNKYVSVNAPVKFIFIPDSIHFSSGVTWYSVIDNISALHLLITAIIISMCFLHAFFNNKGRFHLLSFFLFFIQFLLYIAFSCPNFFIFYVCFEATLIPFFCLISIWGGRVEFKISSAYRLMLFTLVISAPLFFILIFLLNPDFTYDFSHTRTILNLMNPTTQILFISSIVFSFAVKVPLFPFHSWLPDAHGEAPTIGSILLAGVMLKLGSYGLYRVLIPFFSTTSGTFIAAVKMFLITFSLISILISAIIIFSEIDLKRVVALYSVNHMGFVILGFCLSTQGVVGGIIISVAHCFSAAGLFFLAGQIYQRTHSRKLPDIRYIATFYPVLSFFFLLFSLANMGFPGTINFFGEFSVVSSFNTIFNYKADEVLLPYHDFFAFVNIIILIISIIATGISTIWFLIRMFYTPFMFNPVKSPAEEYDPIEAYATEEVEENHNDFPDDMQVPEAIPVIIFIVILIYMGLTFDWTAMFDPNNSYSTAHNFEDWLTSNNGKSKL